jgi:two-component system, OmpR family, response regulator MtrA
VFRNGRNEFASRGGDARAAPNPVVVITDHVNDIGPINELLGQDALVVLAPRVEAAAQLMRGEPEALQPEQEAPQPEQDVIEVGDLAINLSAHDVRWRDIPLPLSEQEISILSCLGRQVGYAFSFAELFQLVWGTSALVDPAVLHSAVQRIRRKLAAAQVAVPIESVRGYGFRLGASQATRNPQG